MKELKFLHADHPMFLAGTNLGDKLPNARFSEAKAYFEQETGLVHVSYKGETGFFSHERAWMMVEGSAKKTLQVAAKAQAAHDTVQRIPSASAQVSTPYGHVHAGPGHGQTGQEPPKQAVPPLPPPQAEAVKRGPGRPPKQ